MSSDNGPEEDGSEEERLKALLEEEKKRSEGQLTRLKYLQADFENYRKRSEKEMKEVESSALRGLVTTLLSAVDELELAIKNAGEKEESGELRDGLKMVHKNLVSTLEGAGLSRIDCLGKPFDPELHEAVEKVQGSSAGEDRVVEEIRPGYLFRGRTVRPSMVKVELALKATDKQEAKASE